MKESGASKTKHVVVADYFRNAVSRGKLCPGDKLPSEPDLAEQFGCSVGTVRRAMSALIHEGIVQPRHGVGVFVSTKPRQKILGVVVHNVRNPDHAHFVDHISAAAGQQGYSVMLCVPYAEEVSHAQGIQTELEFIDRFADLHGTGIVKCPTTVEAEVRLRTRMREREIPFVMVNDYWSDCSDVHHVVCDRRLGMEQALDHLIGLRHRRIAFHSTPRNLAQSAADAFRAAAAIRGIQGELLLSGGDETLNAVVSRPDAQRVTAVVTLYYSLACDLLTQFQNAGARIPEDASLVLLSGLPDERSRPTDFTTVEPPLADMARNALRLLLQDAPVPVTHLFFTPALRIGKTTGPCAVETGQVTQDASR